MIVPAIIEHPLQLLLLIVAFYFRKRPLISLFLILLVLSRQFILAHNIPTLVWFVISAALYATAIVCVFLMRRNLAYLIPAVLMIFLMPSIWHQYQPQKIVADTDIRALLTQNNVLGAVVAIHTDNQDVFAGYGSTVRFGSRPDENTYYEIASVTKVFTGHLLSIDFDPQWVPFATHTAGIPDVLGMPNFWKNYLLAPTDFWAYYSADDLRSDLASIKPNKGQWEYSNAGFCLLGQHLNVRNRSVEGISYQAPDDAVVAAAISNGGMMLPHWGNRACHGAGGRIANAKQLLDFVALASAAKKIYFRDESHIMGLGWKYKNGVWYHAGATFGNSSFVATHPASGTSMVLLASGVIQNIESEGLNLFDSMFKAH